MRDRLLTVYGFFHAWMLAAVLYFWMICLPDSGGSMQMLQTLYFFIPISILYWNREKGKQIWSYLFLSGIFLFCGWFLGRNLLEKTGLIIFTGIIALCYFADRVRNVMGILCRPEYPLLGVFALAYFYSLYFQRTLLERVSLWAAVLYWLLLLWVRNREALLDVCETNQKLHRFPQSAVAANNRLLLFMITFITLAGMILLPFSGLRQGIYSLGRLLVLLISWLLSGLSSEEREEEILPPQEMESPFHKVEAGEMPAFLYMIFQLLEKLLIAAFLLALLAGLVYLIIDLYRKYQEGRGENGDVLEAVQAAGNEKRERIKPRRRITGFLRRYNTEEKIRRYYRRQILKYAKTKPAGTETPEELEERAGMKHTSEKERIHEIYEQARYGNVPCSRKQEQVMKQADRVDFSKEIV